MKLILLVRCECADPVNISVVARFVLRHRPTKSEQFIDICSFAPSQWSFRSEVQIESTN